jgi:hypothetical protein
MIDHRHPDIYVDISNLSTNALFAISKCLAEHITQHLTYILPYMPDFNARPNFEKLNLRNFFYTCRIYCIVDKCIKQSLTFETVSDILHRKLLVFPLVHTGINIYIHI